MIITNATSPRNKVAIVTGASRGIGKAIVEGVSANRNQGSSRSQSLDSGTDKDSGEKQRLCHSPSGRRYPDSGLQTDRGRNLCPIFEN